MSIKDEAGSQKTVVIGGIDVITSEGTRITRTLGEEARGKGSGGGHGKRHDGSGGGHGEGRHRYRGDEELRAERTEVPEEIIKKYSGIRVTRPGNAMVLSISCSHALWPRSRSFPLVGFFPKPARNPGGCRRYPFN